MGIGKAPLIRARRKLKADLSKKYLNHNTVTIIATLRLFICRIMFYNQKLCGSSVVEAMHLWGIYVEVGRTTLPKKLEVALDPNLSVR